MSDQKSNYTFSSEKEFKEISKEDFQKIEGFTTEMVDALTTDHLKMLTDEQAYSFDPKVVVELQKKFSPGIIRDYFTSAGRVRIAKEARVKEIRKNLALKNAEKEGANAPAIQVSVPPTTEPSGDPATGKQTEDAGTNPPKKQKKDDSGDGDATE